VNPPGPFHTNCRNILVIDDDPMVLYALEATLQTANYPIFATEDPFSAIEYAKTTPIAVAISDQRMDKMPGLELLQHIRALQPNTSRILITGLLSVQTLVEAINRGEIHRFLGKPWSNAEVIATVQNAVQRYQLLEHNAELQDSSLRLNQELKEIGHRHEMQIAELANQKSLLAETIGGLRESRLRQFDFCDAMLHTFSPILGRQTRQSVEIVKMLAESAGLNAGQTDQLTAAAWAHDLGLITYSREYLWQCLTGRIEVQSDAGALFRAHPLHSQKLAASAGFGGSVSTAVRAHHEHFDGSGYPDGLAGAEIPESARWLAPVVHFTATSAPRDEVVDEIQRLAGSMFDPAVVQQFLKIALKLPMPAEIANQPASMSGSSTAAGGKIAPGSREFKAAV
jgi:response regulator RpfG family c-di-GMP phosphodiesterase